MAGRRGGAGHGDPERERGKHVLLCVEEVSSDELTSKEGLNEVHLYRAIGANAISKDDRGGVGQAFRGRGSETKERRRECYLPWHLIKGIRV